MLVRVVTLGVHGFVEESFFRALRRGRVDTFCDIRSRRGLRGARYAFANRRRLESRLSELGIRYVHLHALAPPPWLRAGQRAADAARGARKSERTELSVEFIAGYGATCLAGFDVRSFLAELGSGARVVALFCVERHPAACHRSLLAGRLQAELGVEIRHLIPD